MNTLSPETLVPAGFVFVVLGMVWRIGRGLAKLEARIDRGETRQDVQAETIADHEARVRRMEQHSPRRR